MPVEYDTRSQSGAPLGLGHGGRPARRVTVWASSTAKVTVA